MLYESLKRTTGDAESKSFILRWVACVVILFFGLAPATIGSDCDASLAPGLGLTRTG